MDTVLLFFFFWLFIYESASRFYIDLDRTTVAYTLLSSRFSFLVDLVLVLVPCILHVSALHLCVMHFIALSNMVERVAEDN